MHVADIVALTVMALSGLWGLISGFWALVLGFVAWGLAGWITLHVYRRVMLLILPYMPGAPVAAGLALLICFVVLLLTLSVVAGRIARAVKGSVLGTMDRLLGMVLGVVIGFGVLSVGFVVLHMIFGQTVLLGLHGSSLAPYIEGAATYLEETLPGLEQTGLAPFRAKGHDAAI